MGKGEVALNGKTVGRCVMVSFVSSIALLLMAGWSYALPPKLLPSVATGGENFALSDTGDRRPGLKGGVIAWNTMLAEETGAGDEEYGGKVRHGGGESGQGAEPAKEGGLEGDADPHAKINPHARQKGIAGEPQDEEYIEEGDETGGNEQYEEMDEGDEPVEEIAPPGESESEYEEKTDDTEE